MNIAWDIINHNKLIMKTLRHGRVRLSDDWFRCRIQPKSQISANNSNAISSFPTMFISIKSRSNQRSNTNTIITNRVWELSDFAIACLEVQSSSKQVNYIVYQKGSRKVFQKKSGPFWMKIDDKYYWYQIYISTLVHMDEKGYILYIRARNITKSSSAQKVYNRGWETSTNLYMYHVITINS